MNNYDEDYLKQVADLGGANSKNPLEEFYQLNGVLIRFFGMINTQFELWLQNKNIDVSTISHILNTLNQYKSTLASLKFESSHTDITEYEGNARTRIEKQLAYIKNEMVLEEADLVLQNLKQLKSTPKAEPKPEKRKNDSNFLRTFLKTEYGEGYTYEGDLLNNLPNDNGALYYPNKQLYAIGTWVNGKLHNNAKVYYNDGKLWMEGIFKDGKLNGKGKLFNHGLYQDSNKGWVSILEGNFIDGECFGKGRMLINGNLKYEGEFVNSKFEGEGCLYDSVIENQQNQLYAKGIFKNGILNGYGKIYDVWHKLLKEEGYFVNWKLEGYGKTFYSNGNIEFDGIFQNGLLKTGKLFADYGNRWIEGDFYWDKLISTLTLLEIDIWRCLGKEFEIANNVTVLKSEGTIKNGTWIFSLFGQGIKYDNNTVRKKGWFENDKLDGPNGELYLDGILFEKGTFKEDNLHGEGVRYFINYKIGKINEIGKFNDGKLHGYGRRYDKFSDEPIEQGQFINGTFQGK